MPSKLRDFVMRFCSALDLFIVDKGRAISVANESYKEAANNEELIQNLNAVLLYNKQSGETKYFLEKHKFKIDRRVTYKMTALNNSGDADEVKALIKYFEKANRTGLPTRPYLGISADEASSYIIQVIKRLISVSESVTGHGSAKSGWNNNIKNEYDFQNLFWITVKPWLPDLGREEVAVVYDGNEKRSDFSLFKNQVIIELKHIRDDNEKRNTIKTLEGLKSFYTMYPNIRVLIFGILVEKTLDLDDHKWEHDFSYLASEPKVKTVVIRNK